MKKWKKNPGDIISLRKCTINDNQIICGSWDMVLDRDNFFILNHFLPFYSPQNTKNQDFQKMKKTPSDITLQMCIINENHMMYGSWDMVLDRDNFFILNHFLPFYSPQNTKNQDFQKMKKTPSDITLQMCIINENHMMYGSWDMVLDGWMDEQTDGRVTDRGGCRTKKMGEKRRVIKRMDTFHS